MTVVTDGTDRGQAGSGRRYDNRLRRQRASDTRDRIVAAGCDLIRGMSVRDWKGLTIRLVAEQAAVNESTVYRHFGSEHGLKDAVMRQLEHQSGIDLDRLTLGDVTDVAARLIAVVSSHPLASPAPLDETLTETGRRQREALVRAVATETPGWTTAERRTAAAMIDVLWAVAAYERLAVDWGLSSDQAIDGVTWVVGLVEEAVRQGRRPAPGSGGGAGSPP